MRTRERTLRSEQGAVFVQVGISLFVLMSFNVFVLDYGMMWIGRRQAQNAADAGALAGAVARGYDDFADPPSAGGLADLSAGQVAAANLVWQEAGTPVVTFDCPGGGPGRCVRVEVFRDGTNGSTALPTLFGPILGITTQKVKASATAIVGSGNATDCLRPIAMADDWVEQAGPGNEFNSYDLLGNPLPGSRDLYSAPSGAGTGSAATISDDFGLIVFYDLDDTTTAPATPITRQLVVPLDLRGTGTLDPVDSCNGQMVEIGETRGVITAPTAFLVTQGLDTVWTRDTYPPVTWNNAESRVEGSCAPGCAPISPRMMPIALFDPDRFQRGRATGDWTSAGCPTNSPCITITNIIGFFVHCVAARPCDGNVTPHGHFMRYPGMTSSTGPPPFVDDASWLVTTHLIR